MAGEELFADLVPNKRASSKSPDNGKPYGGGQEDPVIAPSYDSTSSRENHRDGPMVCVLFFCGVGYTFVMYKHSVVTHVNNRGRTHPRCVMPLPMQLMWLSVHH